MDVFDLIEEEVKAGLILVECYEETGLISASQLVGIFRAIEGLCAASTVKQHSRKSRGTIA